MTIVKETPIHEGVTKYQYNTGIYNYSIFASGYTDETSDMCTKKCGHYMFDLNLVDHKIHILFVMERHMTKYSTFRIYDAT